MSKQDDLYCVLFLLDWRIWAVERAAREAWTDEQLSTRQWAVKALKALRGDIIDYIDDGLSRAQERA